MKLDPETIENMKRNASLRPWTVRLEQISSDFNKDGKKVLEIGIAGDVMPGGHAYLFDKTDYQTMDINPEFQPDHVADVCNMPFETATFDVVLCVAVLEHVEGELEKALSEIMRVLKSEGVAFIVFPSEKTDKETEPFYRNVSLSLFDNLPVTRMHFYEGVKSHRVELRKP